jgi:uncharacterized Fe-S cluster protein YjdI
MRSLAIVLICLATPAAAEWRFGDELDTFTKLARPHKVKVETWFDNDCVVIIKMQRERKRYTFNVGDLESLRITTGKGTCEPTLVLKCGLERRLCVHSGETVLGEKKVQDPEAVEPPRSKRMVDSCNEGAATSFADDLLLPRVQSKRPC